MNLIREKEMMANKQLDIQRQSLEQYKMRVEKELEALSRETKHNLEKERTVNKLKDEFEYMRTQHTVKLSEWENNLNRKEEQLLHQTHEVDLLKQNLSVAQNHIEATEKKLNIELLEREMHLRQREEEVNYNLQRNNE